MTDWVWIYFAFGGLVAIRAMAEGRSYGDVAFGFFLWPIIIAFRL